MTELTKYTRSDSNAIIDALTRKGTEISLQVTIDDSELAKDLLASAFEDEPRPVSGMVIRSWSTIDDIAAYEERDRQLTVLQDRHLAEMIGFMERPLESFVSNKRSGTTDET